MTPINAGDLTADTNANAKPGAPATAADLPTRMLAALSAATLTTSGYIHAQLYIDGYRYIHIVGVLFLLQAAASFALATLLLAGTVARPSVLIELGAAATTLGALAGFTASRTIGVFGFTEHGLQPAPQALVSVLAEAATLTLLAVSAARALRRAHRVTPTTLPPRS